ncbi:hypothetical protein BH09MYX1_BH09MYX1_03350 [soil metagenome]
MKRFLVVSSILGALATAAAAHADSPPEPTAWRARYEIARNKIARGECQSAIGDFDTLSKSATSEADRELASEMSRVCHETLLRPEPAPDPRLRTTDEITILYANAFLYGLGTSAWFVLETEPNNVLLAMLPFAGFTIGAVGAVALIDHYAPFPRGVPAAIATGLYLGLGEGVLITAFQAARSTRIDNETGHDPKWSTANTATALWAMGTLGAVTGGLIGYAREPTPGEVGFAASCTLWGGLLTAGLAGAIHPDDSHRLERTLVVGGIGYNAGLLGGIIFGPKIAPSVARMRFVDLGGVAGGLLFGGAYALAAGKDADSRAGLGIATAGAALGLGITWLATSRMDRESPSAKKPLATIGPTIAPVPGGGTLGVAGVF